MVIQMNEIKPLNVQFVKDYIRVIGSNNRYTFEVADNGSKE